MWLYINDIFSILRLKINRKYNYWPKNTMKNILIIWVWEWLWSNLIDSFLEKKNYDNIYTISRKQIWRTDVTHILGDVNQDIDLNKIAKNTIDTIIYIPSLWWTNSKMTCEEFDDYMTVWPRWLLNCFHQLRNWGYLKNNSLFVSIGSTASETSLNLWHNPSSSIYSLSKLTQKSVLLQLSHLYKDYRYLNITLGSIWTENDGGVGYKNIYSTIDYVYSMNDGVRYTEVQLVSSLDIFE